MQLCGGLGNKIALQELTSPHGLADAPALLKFHLTALGAGRMGALNEDYGSNVPFPLFLSQKVEQKARRFANLIFSPSCLTPLPTFDDNL